MEKYFDESRGVPAPGKPTFCYHCHVRYAAVLIALATLFSPAALSASEGPRLFSAHCAGCHGKGGGGASAPALRKEGLLITVEQGYFSKSIEAGRTMRGCPSFKGRIAPEEAEAIAAHIKSWQEGELLASPAHEVAPSYSEEGERLFGLCGGCHGTSGEGAMGPPLLDPGFLESASDADLRRTIMHGRPGTPMKGFLVGDGAFYALTPGEIDSVISYMRYIQKNGGRPDAERLQAP